MASGIKLPDSHVAAQRCQMPTKSARKPHDREYHIVHHDRRWWVENDDGTSRHSSPSEQDALRWALDAAAHDHARGLDVIVCVEQADGSVRMAWASP